MRGTPQYRDAYRRLEQALADILRMEGGNGVVTDWTLIYASERLDAPGMSVGRVLPENGMPFYRMLGLLDQALVQARNDLGR